MKAFVLLKIIYQIALIKSSKYLARNILINYLFNKINNNKIIFVVTFFINEILNSLKQ